MSANILSFNGQPTEARDRVFLLLQGPHGPFFDRIAKQLTAAGAQVWRVSFNAGDEFFWSDKARLIRHVTNIDAWPEHLQRIIVEKKITDIALYGDVRPVHAIARDLAEKHRIKMHVFEEGYLRPFWITYERGGSNGNSALMSIPLERMRNALREDGADMRRPPARWGDMRQHKFYGAVYHACVLIANQRYKGWQSHRNISVWQEFRLNFRNLMLTPYYAAHRWLGERRIRFAGFPYFLVLLQLEHDANFQAHSPYNTTAEFAREVLNAFAASAPPHHHLVFKAHPLEDGRGKARAAILEHAEKLGIGQRVHFVHGGKLARLLADTRATVTVNSTSAQQALWRGLPVKAMGNAIYAKPAIVSEQSLDSFFRDPMRPDPKAYRKFRDYLLETSQLPGGFYASTSRAHVLRLIIDMMLSENDPYAALDSGPGPYRIRPGDDLA